MSRRLLGRYPRAMAAPDPAPVATISWRQALAWRMERQFLQAPSDGSVTDVVRRMAAVQAQVASSAELAIRMRRSTSRPGDVARALRRGSILKTWAMRGTLHLITPEEGAAFLSLMASGRPWERPSWVSYFGLTPANLERMREFVSEALEGRTLTREELIAAIAAKRSLRHLADGLRSGWGTLLKPLAWGGDLCFGPNQGTDASPRWRGIPDHEEAAPIAIAAYLRAYGPTTGQRFGRWLASGWFGKRHLQAWFERLADRVVPLEIEGERAFVLEEDLDSLLATKPTRTVRLLGGFDQWVLGPGTDDARVLPTAHRRLVSTQSGWIAPCVVNGGVVAGTWSLDGSTVRVAWFADAGRVPRRALASEVDRLGAILEHEVALEVRSA
jgi:hypothetical protein